ncbi:hypothetical protein AMECASPLE_037453 [Ameca splendens]|uniref:Uncharacterized protein n=1 Tax=Ameca splendens TaxID=208324 RepID=A0ABV1A3A6_9TELE
MMVDFSGTSIYPGPSSKICSPVLRDESASGTPTTGAVFPLLNTCPSVFGCPCVLDSVPVRFLVPELTCMNSSCHLWSEASGWQQTDSSFLRRTCDRTLLTLHRVYLPSRSAKTHHAVPSSSSSWINFTHLWLIIGSQTPLIPPWRFIISSL